MASVLSIMRWASVFVFLGIFHLLKAQQGVISADELNVLYTGLPNPISFAIPGVPFQKTVIKTTQGIVIKNNDVFEIHIPERKAPETTISIGKIDGKDTVWVYAKKFRLQNVPKPTIFLGGFPLEEPIKSLPVLMVQNYMRAVLEDFIYNGVRMAIKGYHCYTVSQVYGYNLFVVSGYSLEPLSEIFRTLKPGDFVIFDSIHVVGPGRDFCYNNMKLTFEPTLYPQYESKIFSLDGVAIDNNNLPENLRKLNGNMRIVTKNLSDPNYIKELVYKNKQIVQYKDSSSFGYYSYNYTKDSFLTIKVNDTISIGKARLVDQLKIENKYNAVPMNDTVKFIYKYLHAANYYPFGKWATKLNDRLIAKGSIEAYYYSYEDPSDYDMIFPPPYLEYILKRVDVPIKNGKNSDPENWVYCWYLKPGPDFKFFK